MFAKKRVVRFLRLFVLAAAVPAVLSAQSGPQITSVQPPSAPYFGNIPVTIRGAALAVICDFAPCPDPQVWFGTTRAEVTSISSDQLVVRAPAHRIGNVDVSVVRNDGETATARGAFTYLGARAKESVLLPLVMNSVGGGYGSRWSTSLIFVNRTSERVTIDPIHVTVPPQGEVRDPEQLGSLPSERSPGRVIDLPRDLRDRFTIRLSGRESSGSSAGFEIPVVHEHDCRVDALHLANVPIASGFRNTLRLYLIEVNGNRGVEMSFLVEFFDPANRGAAIASTHLTTRPTRPNNPNAGLFVYPATAEIINLVTAHPELTGLAEVDIVVSPLSLLPVVPPPAPLFWAFVSTTNNATQEVTLVTPE